MTQSFKKREKLVSKKLIDQLFAKGGNSRSAAAFPLRLVYQYINKEESDCKTTANAVAEAQLLISVPKRCFKHAVDRNRVKRQIREAYRKHRDLFTVPEDRRLILSLIWLDSNHHSTAEVEERVCNLLGRVKYA